MCASCVHLYPPAPFGSNGRRWGLFCAAYADGTGIPDAILDLQADHRKPYVGDHGIKFEQDSTKPEPDFKLLNVPK